MMRNWLKGIGLLSTAGLILYGCTKDNSLWNWMIPETSDSTTTAQVAGFVFNPAIEPATPENIAKLRVPAGFTVSKFADSVGKPRILVISTTGNVYTSDREAGTVTMLRDLNGDGKADSKETVARIPQAHGLYIHNNKMYITGVRDIYVSDIVANGQLSAPKLIVNNLPDGGQHPNRTIAFGPDNKLYISVGSTCNACKEPNTMNATMVQANEDGTNQVIYSKGLRNTIGFGWHPTTGEMWGMDHGIDWLGDNDQEEELNQIKQNANYGWPYIYANGKYNPQPRPTGDTTYQQLLSLSTLPSLTYQAHSAPMQMAFYTASKFPAEFKNDAFVAMRGSWNRSAPVGYKVVRVHFENGKPVRIEDFLTGFLVNNNKSIFGRLVGVAVHPDGSLLVSDDTNGVIYRVAHS